MYQPQSRPLLPPNVDDDHALEQNDKENEQHFEEFFEDVYYELRNYGKLEELNVCDNIGPHLIGNVYVKYRHEEDAEKALRSLTGRFYGGRPIVAEFSPVTDFREACCRQNDLNECTRGGECNFMHLKRVSSKLYKDLFGRYPRSRKSGDYDEGYDRRHRSRSRSRSRSGSRRSRSRSRSRSRERRHGHRDRHHRHHDDRRSSRDGDRHSSSRKRDRDDEDRGRDRHRGRDRDREGHRDRDGDRDGGASPNKRQRGESGQDDAQNYGGQNPNVNLLPDYQSYAQQPYAQQPSGYDPQQPQFDQQQGGYDPQQPQYGQQEAYPPQY